MILTWSIGIANPTPMLPASPAAAARGRDRGVHPDHLSGEVDQRAAGVAGVDRGVGLHGVDVGRVVDPVSLVVTGRFRALTMPEVTVELSPSGEPNATTWSPTRSTCADAQARRRQVRPVLHVEHGEVVGRAATDDRRGVLVAVLVDDLDRAVVARRRRRRHGCW